MANKIMIVVYFKSADRCNTNVAMKNLTLAHYLK